MKKKIETSEEALSKKTGEQSAIKAELDAAKASALETEKAIYFIVAVLMGFALARFGL